MLHEISYLSGFWWLVAMLVAYLLTCALVPLAQKLYWRNKIRRDSEARQRYYLTEAKEREGR